MKVKAFFLFVIAGVNMGPVKCSWCELRGIFAKLKKNGLSVF